MTTHDEMKAQEMNDDEYEKVEAITRAIEDVFGFDVKHLIVGVMNEKGRSSVIFNGMKNEQIVLNYNINRALQKALGTNNDSTE
jgi:hypothetical protein